MARMKSLRGDQNDQNALKWGRYKHIGHSVASEFYQPCPMFFTREGSDLNMIGSYRGATAFLVASGPSFGELEHDKLYQAGAWVMTLNNAVASFRGQAGCIVDDPSRFTLSLWRDPKIMKFVPMCSFEKPLWNNSHIYNPETKLWEQKWEPANMKVGECPNVIGFRRNEKFMAKRFLYEDKINWGNHKDEGPKGNKGGRSVLLASMRILFLLGFRRVNLCGVDFQMSENKKYHFDEGRTPAAIRGNNSTYSKMIKWFEELQPYFLAEDFIVHNCNPDSALTAFPYKPFDEAIAEACDMNIGDPSKERTMGMYSKWEDKMSAWKAGSDQPEPDLPKKEEKANVNVQTAHGSRTRTVQITNKSINMSSASVKPRLPPKA